MTDWTAVWAVAGVVLVLVLTLARVTTAALTADGEAGDAHERPSQRAAEPCVADADVAAGGGAAGGGSTDDAADGETSDDVEAVPERTRPSEADPVRAAPERSAVASSAAGPGDRPGSGSAEATLPSISTAALLANVVVTHGALAAVLLGAAALAAVPWAALGVDGTAWSTGLPAVVGGIALGLGLALSNAALAANLDRFGIDHSDALRTALAPDSALGWVVLLGVVLPLVALFEELLFRAVLVGAAGAATGLSPWLFVVPASVAFAMGHGLQGRGGLVVTGLLGAVLASAFVLTNSLLLVVVAHYVVNAVEFLLHEWLGVDVQERLAV